MNEDLDQTLAAAMQRLGRAAPHHEMDADRIRHMARGRRLKIVSPVAAVLTVGAILAGMAWARPTPTDPAATTSPSACTTLDAGAPPVWARGGFTGNSYPPFATSRSGDIVAIVFGDPLTSPPAANHNNKILWVVRGGSIGDMDVTAHREGSDTTTTMRVPAGPSIVDMPSPGCWRLDIAIGDRGLHDSINLRWVSPGSDASN